MPFVVTDAILGASVLKQVTNSSHRTGAAVRSAKTSGAATISEIYGVRQEDVTTLTTGDCDTLLDLNSNNFISQGLSVLSGTVTVPFKNRANGGLFEGATAHSQITGANALIIPTGIEASQDSEQGATATCEIHWLSTDGHTQAVTGSAGNSLASEAFTVEFGLGIADINGTDLDTLTGIRVNPGISVVKQSANGGIWPRKASIQMVEPTIDVTVHDIDEVITLTDGFTNLTSFECYLRRRSDGGTYVANGTATHIKLSFAAGIAHAETIDAPESGNGSVTIRLYGKALAASTTSAIA